MDSESKRVSWTAKLRQQFYTLCSEADAIVPQEPVEYVRDQFLTVGESLKQFYTELVEDALPMLVADFLELDGPTSPKQEGNTGSPSHKMSNISVDDGQEEISPVTSSSHLLSAEPDFSYTEKGNIGSFPEANLAMEVEENKLPGDEVTSSASNCSTETTHSFVSARSECESPNELLGIKLATVSDPVSDLSECISNGEAPERRVAEEAAQPSGIQKLDESLILLDWGEFCSDSTTDAYHVPYQKLLKKLAKKHSREAALFYLQKLLKKLAKKHSSEPALKVIDAEMNPKEWERLVEEDFNDSDWEII